jgi:drug/metabolite transporter (DMT)-like permease
VNLVRTTTKHNALLQLLLVGVIWGGTLPLIAFAGQVVNPVLPIAARFVIAAVPLLGFLRGITRALWRDGMALGAVGFLIYLGQAMALQTISVNRAAILLSLNLIFVPVFLWLLGRKFSSQHALVALLGLAGVMVMKSDLNLMDWSVGDAWALLGACAKTIRLLGLERCAQRHDPWRLTAVQLLTAAVISLVFAAPIAVSGFAQLPVLLGVNMLGSLLYLGLAATLLTTFLLVRVQSVVTSFQTGMVLSLELVVAAGFAWVLLGQVPTSNGFCGGLLVIVAGLLMDARVGPRLEFRGRV